MKMWATRGDLFDTKEECLATREGFDAVEVEVIEWVRCDYVHAEQYRSRILTGSVGLEGAWTDWKDGKPERIAMNCQYEFRRLTNHIGGVNGGKS